jgi:MFS transporter, SP family, sugar:H+ symporter
MWQAAGFAEDKALLINVISGAINIGSTIIAMLLIDRIGRRPMLLGGALVMAASLGLVAWLFSNATTRANGDLALDPGAAKIALIAAHVYLIGFAVTWGPCLWVLLSEMFPNQIRASAMAIGTFTLWIANFAITMTFPVFLKTIGLGGSYWIYTAFALLAFFVVLRFVRETKGRSLESISIE